MNEFRARPLYGGGAGSFQAYWLEHRQIPVYVRDAHSVYLQTAAETGIFGALLVTATLVLPLSRVRRARHRPLWPYLAAAYFAYLVHAGVDWDWQMPAVTLPALFCGVMLLQSEGDAGAVSLSRRPVLG